MEESPIESLTYLIQGTKEKIHCSRPRSRQNQMLKYLKLKTKSLFMHQSQEIRHAYLTKKPLSTKNHKSTTKNMFLHPEDRVTIESYASLSPSTNMANRRIATSFSPKRFFTHKRKQLELKDIPTTPSSFITESLIDDFKRFPDLPTRKSLINYSRGSVFLTPVGSLEPTLRKETSNSRLIKFSESLKKRKPFQVKPFYSEVPLIQEPMMPHRKLSACIVITSNTPKNMMHINVT